MGSPNPNANNSLVLSDASIDPSPSGEDTGAPQDDSQNLDQDREYGCKYCHKKFTNKQALGGHQNAHKVERALEKSARDLHDNHYGSYFTSSSAYAGISSDHLAGNSYNRTHDHFVDRPIINRPYCYHQPTQQHGAHIGYNARPVLPATGGPYAPPRPLLGYNNAYSGWAGPLPRISQYNQHPSYYNMPNRASNHRFAGQGSSGNSSVNYPVSHGSRFRGSSNRMNDLGNQQVEDNSDLDLSLKL